MKIQLFILCGLLAVTNSYARDYSITQITNYNYNEYSKINSRGDVAWISWLNATDPGWTVFVYNAATKTSAPISGNTVYFDTHEINNHGDVVWTQYDGNDQEVFLYQSATQTVTQISSNNVEDSSPKISDNGDISWITKAATGNIMMRYDAASQSSMSLDFVGASSQGLNSININGDIVWNATVGGDQEVMLYDAASGSIRNLSNNNNILDSNQQIMDNGDVVWNAQNLLAFRRSIVRYKASTGKTKRIVKGSSGFLASSKGNVVWTTFTNNIYTISTFDPKTENIVDIAQQTSAKGPNIFGISARGDVIWRTIIGTDYFTRVYNAQTKQTLDLALGFGVYDFDIAENGDVVWSLWDGINDYEIHSYQATSGIIIQLTNNNVDDGITSINAGGSIVWSRFYDDSWELLTAVKNPLSLTIAVKLIELKILESAVNIEIDFVSNGIPDFNETVSVSLEGVNIVSAPLGDFDSENGIHTYQTTGTEIKLDFNTGTMVISKNNFDVANVSLGNSVIVEVRFGAAIASDTINI